MSFFILKEMMVGKRRERRLQESKRERERDLHRNDLARKELLEMTVLFVGVNTVDVHRLWKTFMTMAWTWLGFKCGCLKKSVH